MILSLISVHVLLAAAPAGSALQRLTVDGEIGPSYVVQNDNRYGPDGTAYTAREVGQQRNLFLGKRLSIEALLGERHTVILLYAPLDLTTRVTLSRDLDFKGQRFSGGEVVDHRYLFEGYRASYLFGALRRDALRLDLGASVQIRNASVELRSVDTEPARFAVENDVGVVFALKARLTWHPSPRWWATFEADGISSFGVFRSFSGGLYDAALTAGTPLGRGAEGFLRLRWLGGGATVERRNIDNWANLFFVLAGARIELTSLLE